MDTRAGQDVKENEIFILLPDIEQKSPVRRLKALSQYWLTYQASHILHKPAINGGARSTYLNGPLER
jgi:hypothetical protein